MSENMQITLKSENEIDKKEIETLMKVLKKADIADNAIIMLKEMEQEVNKAVLKEEKEKYKRQKSNAQKPPQKVYPLVYLLSEVSYIARIKDNKGIDEFYLYKIIDTITQLQESKIYIRILDKVDTQTLNDKFNNQNSTYTRVIEVRFQKAI